MYCHIKNCTGIILAGGENRRMPVQKAFIKVDGERIVEKNLRLLKQLFQEIFIVTDQPEMYISLGIPLLGDIYNVRGPMTGVLTALLNSSNQWVFISACDMPFLNNDLIVYMASKRDNYDIVIPKYDETNPPIPPLLKGGKEGLSGKTEPLFAFYSKKLMPDMEKAILAAETGLKDFLVNKRVKYILSGEIKKIDAGLRSFINLNTPEDVKYYLCAENKQLKTH